MVLFIFKFVHCIVCLSLIFIVFLQTGKSGGMVGIFGSGRSDQILDVPSGMVFIKKLTIVMACTFLFTSLMITKLSTNINIISIVNKPSSTVANTIL
jgi:preprotein translocase subunit SecG